MSERCGGRAGVPGIGGDAGMILNEKAVCSAMKRDVKDGGYVAFGMMHEGEHWIGINGYGGWLILAAKSSMPRKILALIVEHAGALPEVGQSWKLEKPKKGEIQRQDTLFTIVGGEAAELMDGEWHNELVRIPMTLEGYSLWQDRENLRVKLVSPELEDLAAWDGKAKFDGRWMAAEGLTSWCFITREPDNVTHEVWLKHLSQMSWVG